MIKKELKKKYEINLVIGLVIFFTVFTIFVILNDKLNILIADFTNPIFLTQLSIILIFTIVIFNLKLKKKDLEEKLKDGVRKALIALIIAYIAHIDLIFAAFWLVFTVVINEYHVWL